MVREFPKSLRWRVVNLRVLQNRSIQEISDILQVGKNSRPSIGFYSVVIVILIDGSQNACFRLAPNFLWPRNYERRCKYSTFHLKTSLYFSKKSFNSLNFYCFYTYSDIFSGTSYKENHDFLPSQSLMQSLLSGAMVSNNQVAQSVIKTLFRVVTSHGLLIYQHDKTNIILQLANLAIYESDFVYRILYSTDTSYGRFPSFLQCSSKCSSFFTY